MDNFEPHQLRVVEEKNSLELNLLKLESFISSDKFKEIDSVEQMYLTEQAHFMFQYLEILKQRISLFLERNKQKLVVSVL